MHKLSKIRQEFKTLDPLLSWSKRHGIWFYEVSEEVFSIAGYFRALKKISHSLIITVENAMEHPWSDKLWRDLVNATDGTSTFRVLLCVQNLIILVTVQQRSWNPVTGRKWRGASVDVVKHTLIFRTPPRRWLRALLVLLTEFLCK